MWHFWYFWSRHNQTDRLVVRCVFFMVRSVLNALLFNEKYGGWWCLLHIVRAIPGIRRLIMICEVWRKNNWDISAARVYPVPFRHDISWLFCYLICIDLYISGCWVNFVNKCWWFLLPRSLENRPISFNI